jgi:hypothetical protein
VVRLENTDYIASPDARGNLEIRDLLPGPYHAVVVDTLLAQLGITMPTSLRFVAQRDSISEHRMIVPPIADFVRKDCGKTTPLPDGGSLLVARAVTPDGRGVPHANWQILRDFGVSWQLVAQNQRTSTDGMLNHCLRLMPGDPIEVRVWRDGEPPVVVRHTVMKSFEILKITLPPARR